MAFDPARVVQVRVTPRSFGSGYLLTDRLVVTAAHVVRGALPEGVKVRLVAADGVVRLPVEAVRCAQDEGVDVALLRLPDGAVAGKVTRWSGMPALGEIDRTASEPVACMVVGFPRAQLLEGRRDSEQVLGHIPPQTTVRARLLTVDVHGSTPLPDPGEQSAWAGMSGAAVFAGPYLVGVITDAPRRFGGKRLEATEASALTVDRALAQWLPDEAVLERVRAACNYDVGAGIAVHLRPPYQVLPAGLDLEAQPRPLLEAAYGLVRFHGRQAQLGELTTWCRSDRPFGLRLVTGPGGAGKSRLAAELCLELLKAGWHAGIVRSRVPGPTVPLAPDRPALLIVDYPMSHIEVDVVVQLARHLVYRPAGPPVRVVLVARSRGAWWDTLLRTEPVIENVVADDLALSDDPLGDEERGAHYDAAARSFAAWLRCEGPPLRPPDLSGDTFRFPLLIHLLALLHVLGDRVPADSATPAKLLDAFLRHEARYWEPVFDRCRLPEGHWHPAVTLATMVGAESREDLKLLLTAIPDYEQDVSGERLGEIADALHELYPGTPYLAPLEPDLLTERLIARYATDAALLVRVLDRARSDSQVVRLLTTLARAATNATTGNRAEVTAALQGLVQQRLPDLLDRALAPYGERRST
jgi:hypothetical protein